MKIYANVRTLTKFADFFLFFFSQKRGVFTYVFKKQKRTERSHNAVSVIPPLCVHGK